MMDGHSETKYRSCSDDGIGGNTVNSLFELFLI